MIEIKKWTGQFLAALEETFGGRIWFFGLQGSYGRGEATEDSDIDLVVILDELSPADIQAYSRMLERFAERPFLCGFLAGKEELMEAAGEEERRILRTFAHLKQGGAIEFGEMSETLFLWTKKWIGKEKLS